VTRTPNSIRIGCHALFMSASSVRAEVTVDANAERTPRSCDSLQQCDAAEAPRASTRATIVCANPSCSPKRREDQWIVSSVGVFGPAHNAGLDRRRQLNVDP